MKSGLKMKKLSLLMSITLLAACSGGSGGGGSEREVDTDSGPVSGEFIYNGPAPASEEIQNFKRNFYDPLAANDRCGECHTPGGQGTTAFVDQTNVNEAWQVARSVVNLDDPGASRVVSRVSDGHHCWLGAGQEEACATTIIGYIERWAAGAVATAATVQLAPRRAYRPGGARRVPANLADAQSLGLDLAAPGQVLGMLQRYCADCHSDTAPVPQVPYFASADPAIAFAALRSRISLNDPAQSRIVLRLYPEAHNCWSDCEANADELRGAIAALAGQVEPTEVDPALVTSMAQVLEADGIVASAGGRYESDLVAKWEFREGSGNTVADTSGVQPEIPLSLSGQFSWMASWGVRFVNGKAQGGVSGSGKLHAQLSGTGEYTVEAWVAPANVTQEEAWIAAYSGGPASSNVVLRQSLYNYEALTRSSEGGGSTSGEPLLATSDDAELAQATLQHVVLTYDPTNGRRLFVNGEFTGDEDPLPGGLLNNWNESFALVLGNSTAGSNPWAGAMRMVAVHNRALNEEQILRNFEVGVGQKYYLMFSVSELLSGEASCSGERDGEPVNYCYVVFETSQFDDTSYLFNTPFFVNLNPEGGSFDFPVSGIRLGVNGSLVSVGQAFVNVNEQVDRGVLGEEGQRLSPLGTIVALEQGAEEDVFFLAFDRIGDLSAGSVTELPGTFQPVYAGAPASDVAMRTFDEVNAALSALTGVPVGYDAISAVTGKTVGETFDAVRRALPSTANFNAFSSSHQMAATQLAAAYCDALVQDNSLRTALFSPAFDFDQPVANPGIDWRNEVAAPLVDRAANIGLLPDDYRDRMLDEIERLITDDRDLAPYVFLNGEWVPDPDPAAHNKRDGLMFCENDQPCPASRTAEVVKASCTSVFGSALVLVK